MPAHLAQLDKPQLEDKLSVQIATQDVQHARPRTEPKSAQIVWLIMDFKIMPARHVQMDKHQLEGKIPAQIVKQDVQHAQPPMEPKSAQAVPLIMGMLMVLAHSAQLAKLQLESKLRALPAPTKDALPVHQQVAPKFA